MVDEIPVDGAVEGEELEQKVLTPEPELEPKLPIAAAAEAEVEAEEKKETPKAPPKADWRDKRIAKLTAQLREKQAEPVLPASGDGKLDAQEVERLATIRAREIAAEQKFEADCQAARVRGDEAFPDFKDRLNNLAQLVDKDDGESIKAYRQFLQTALETGEAEKIVHALGGDLEEAQRIFELSPTKQAVELTKLAGREPKELSKAPKPLTPIGSRAAQHQTIDPADAARADQLTTAEWMKRRSAQVAAKDARR